jgi:sugar phosphate isomerase/epimerase
VKFQFQMSTITQGFIATEYFTKYPGRFFSMHVQDVDLNATLPAGGRGGVQVSVGKRSIDWVKTFTAAKVGGVKNYFVEQNMELTNQGERRRAAGDECLKREGVMKRREFLIGAAAAAGLFSRRSWAQTRDEAKLRRVAIMSLCFNSMLKNPSQPDAPARTLDVMDLGQMLADRYGVHNVEMQHAHFPSTEPAYLKDFRDRLAKTQSQVTNINLEFGPQNISAADPALRQQAIDRTKEWIDHAVALGCPRIMINQGAPTQENEEIAIAALKAMGDYGKSKNIKVAMENRGGGGGRQSAAAPANPAPPAPPASPAPPAPAAWILLVEIIKGSGTWANCDLGNFPDQETQHAGIRGMFPLTDGNCHVKLNPARYDLPAALALVKQLGYTGLYSIEAGGGSGTDPHQAVQNIYDVLLPNM